MTERAKEPSKPRELPPFDPNGYRKRVLSAVERRGGPDASDAFELYDVPLDAELDDATVAARVAEVWAFWQRQRDHPRYRALVALLVETHAERSADLLDAHTRRAAAGRALVRREAREAQRYALLDAAIERLVQRHGGVPRDKVAGLEEVGALGGLSADEVATRVRRHRLLGPTIGAEQRRQIRALLDEFGRLTTASAPPTLLALLGLVPSATEQQVAAGLAAWRSRARELPAVRLRAVVDELLVFVGDLLAPGRAAVEVYLDAVAADVTDYLRPRVRAAVLVEDRLVVDDHAHLLAEAVERGLDERRSAAVIAALAAELGAPVEPIADTGRRPDARPGDDPGSRRTDGRGGPGPADGSSGGRAGPDGSTGRRGASGRPGPDGSADSRRASGRSDATGSQRRQDATGSGTSDGGRQDSAALLRQARAAMRAGRPREARRLVDAAVGAGGATGQARALSDEIDSVLADADRRVAAAERAAGERRWAAALDELDDLARTADDVVPDLESRRSRARAALSRADERVAAAKAGAPSLREAALRAVLAECADHAGARRALEELTAIPPDAPEWVNAARDVRGDVMVLWAPSTTDGVTYRVRRMRPDGTWQVVGRVPDSSIEDGGAPPGVEAPIYAVAAIHAGRSSTETRSDAVPGAARRTHAAGAPAAPDAGPVGPAAPTGVLAVRAADGTVEVTWTPVVGVGDVEYRVRRLDGERWRVIGRTRATRMQDGGAPAGLVPVYSVSAARPDGRSAEARSDGG